MVGGARMAVEKIREGETANDNCEEVTPLLVVRMFYVEGDGNKGFDV